MRRSARSLLIGIVVALAAACVGPKGTPTHVPTSTPDEIVSITFAPVAGMAGRDYDQQVAHRELADSFEKAHPHITVQQISQQRGTTLVDLAEQADCFAWSPPYGEPGDLAAIVNLAPFLEADLSFPTDDFFPSLLAQFTQQGQLWGLPGYAVPYVIKYNRGLFGEAGVGIPTADWTTDDFARKAIALTRGSGEQKQYGFVPGVLEYQELGLMVERRGVELMDRTVDPPTVRFDDPATVEALRWYARLTTEHDAKPVYVTDWAQMMDPDWEGLASEGDALIREGRAAMWTDLESVNLFWEPPGIDVGVAPFPAGPNGTAGAYKSAIGYYISAQAEYPQACWQWIVYLTTQPEVSRWVPARRSVLQSEAYAEKVGRERAVAYEVSLSGEDKVPTQQAHHRDEWLRIGVLVWLVPAYGKVVTGRATAERALSDAQRAFDDYRACVIAQDAISDSQGWAACIKEVDPSLPEGMFGG